MFFLISDQMQMIADSYKRKDHLYLETKAYKELESVLEDMHWATLLGKPGDGKSTTAAHLLLKYRDKGFEPILATSPKDWKMLISKHSGKQIFVIDDIFGSLCVEDRKVEDWLPEMEHMEKIVKERKGKLYVVCTSRKYIYKDVEPKVAKFSCFQKISTIDMTDKMYQLTGVEKVAMLKKYAEEYDIEIKDIINNIHHADPPHGFPHCVEMYCTNAFLRQNGIAFFKNPAKCVQRELFNFRDNCGIKFLSLVLVLFNNNNLNATYIDTLQDNATDDEKKLFKATGVPLETGSPGIRKALYGLTNTYLKRDTNGSYSFTHHSLCENVAIMYIRTNATHAIQLLDFQHIMCFMNIQEDFTNNVNAGYGIDAIEQLPLQHLARRISVEIQNGNVSTVCSSRIWQNQSFVNEIVKQFDLISARDDKGRNIVLKVLGNTKRNKTLLPLLQLFYYTIGLDFHQTDKDGRNALHYAFMQKITPHRRVTMYWGCECYFDKIWTVSSEEDAIVGDVYTFLTNTVGIDPHLSDRNGVNPVMLAFQNCAECSCIQALLQTDIPVQRDFQGETYIHYLKRSRASENRFKFLMLYLLEKHIDTDETDFCDRDPHIEYGCFNNPG